MFDGWALRHSIYDVFSGLQWLVLSLLNIDLRYFDPLALPNVEQSVVANDGKSFLAFRRSCFLFRLRGPFPEYNGATLLTLPYLATQLLSLPEREEPGRSVTQRVEQKNVDRSASYITTSRLSLRNAPSHPSMYAAD